MVLNRELHLNEGEMLLVCKPPGWTSFDAVNKIRSLFHVRKIGHAGTLDPLASGLLIVCTGRMTKELASYAGLEKEYDARILLGARTPSFNAETPVIERCSTEGLSAEAVCSALQAFVGPQQQLPPMWSAVKVGGKRLYRYAKEGVEIAREPRAITIYSITPRVIAIPRVECTVVCSKGTYIRTLADDLGQRLGCGAYLEGLVRTRIGPYRLEDAASIEELVAYRKNMDLRPA